MHCRRTVASPTASHSRERGYVLITLIFFVAVLAISLATILPSIKQEIERDREEEMVHRGAQYVRAIRLYYKRNGRYPAAIEDLENSNNVRYLRKRYKDPTVKGEDSPEADFKILRFGDPDVQLGQLGQIPGAQGLQGQPGVNGPGGPASSGARARTLGGQNNLDFAQQPTQSSSTQNGSSLSDSTQTPDAPAQDSNGTPSASAGSPSSDPAASPQDQSSSSKSGVNPVHGGGAMVGVVSTNANTRYPAIREYNKKHHYNEWQFIYDPQNERDGLPKGPWQPAKFPGQAGTQQQVGTPADQMSNPVGQPAGNDAANPAPSGPPPQ